MACGTPVITSNTTSLPEVVGEAALTVDPTDVRAIAGAMARLLDDLALRQELTKAGIQRSQRYTWSRAARHLLAALQ
jgi:glycosyltransferase involved in cell wall biosynthesis